MPPVRGSPAWDQILAALPASALLLFDLGYASFAGYPLAGIAQLTAARVTIVTRAKGNLAFTCSAVLRHTSAIHDDLVWSGSGADRQQLRLISVLHQGTWRRYLTNELDPEALPVLYAVPLYSQRWCIDEAYSLVKRLLGLAYFWCEAEYAVQLQLYAVLLDLGDAVAVALDQPSRRSPWRGCTAISTPSPRPTRPAPPPIWSPTWPPRPLPAASSSPHAPVPQLPPSSSNSP